MFVTYAYKIIYSQCVLIHVRRNTFCRYISLYYVRMMVELILLGRTILYYMMFRIYRRGILFLAGY